MHNTTKHTPGPSTEDIMMFFDLSDEDWDDLTGRMQDQLRDAYISHTDPVRAAAPAMYDALQNLLEWAKGNRGVKEGNPYCKPEVRQALKVLASIQGKKDYLDADTASQAEGR